MTSQNEIIKIWQTEGHNLHKKNHLNQKKTTEFFWHLNACLLSNLIVILCVSWLLAEFGRNFNIIHFWKPKFIMSSEKGIYLPVNCTVKNIDVTVKQIMNKIWGEGLQNEQLLPYLTVLQCIPDYLITLFYLFQILLILRLFDTHMLFLYIQRRNRASMGEKDRGWE